MQDDRIVLTAILSAAFVALVAVLAYSNAVSEKQMQVLVITLPALIYALTHPRAACRLFGKRDAA